MKQIKAIAVFSGAFRAFFLSTFTFFIICASSAIIICFSVQAAGTVMLAAYTGVLPALPGSYACMSLVAKRWDSFD